MPRTIKLLWQLKKKMITFVSKVPKIILFVTAKNSSFGFLIRISVLKGGEKCQSNHSSLWESAKKLSGPDCARSTVQTPTTVSLLCSFRHVQSRYKLLLQQRNIPAFPVSKSLNDKTYYRPGANRPHNNSHLTETPQIYFFFSFRKKNSLRLVFSCIISNKFWSQPNENMLKIAFVRLFHEFQKKDPSRKIKGNFKNFNLMSKILSFRFELKLGVKLW